MTLISLIPIVLVAVAGIWMFIELKRMKHTILAFFIIALVLFGFFSFNFVFKTSNLSIKNVSDLEKGIQLYFSWIGSVFGNIKSLTGQAVGMDWKGNTTS